MEESHEGALGLRQCSEPEGVSSAPRKWVFLQSLRRRLRHHQCSDQIAVVPTTSPLRHSFLRQALRER